MPNTSIFFNIFVGIIGLGAFLASLWMIREAYRILSHEFREIFVWRPMWRRGDEMIRRAYEYVKANGPVATCNLSSRGTVAVCNYSRFQEELFKKLTDCNSSGPKGLCQKILVEVFQTYTFAKNKGVKVLAHTGGRLEMEDLGERVVKAVTGMTRQQVPEKLFDRTVKILFEDDTRLYVPFEDPERFELDVSVFGGTSLQAAEKELIPPEQF
jgi:hypothetical protein